MLKILNYLLIVPIKLYQILLSPLIGPSCRFTPTCSNYAIEAINKHGPFKGFWLAIKKESLNVILGEIQGTIQCRKY